MSNSSFGGRFPIYSAETLSSISDVDITTPSRTAEEIDDGYFEFADNNAVLVKNDTTGEWANRFSAMTCSPRTDVRGGTVTYQGYDIRKGIILRNPSGLARTDEIDTAANIVKACPGAVVGSSFRWILRNTADAAETLTMNDNTGVTLSGTMTTPQDYSREFLVVLDNVTAGSEAVTVYCVGYFQH